jgi:hypothetical protein
VELSLNKKNPSNINNKKEKRIRINSGKYLFLNALMCKIQKQKLLNVSNVDSHFFLSERSYLIVSKNKHIRE